MIIYIDMDDVVADWTGYATKFLNKEFTEERIPEEYWNLLKSNGRLYRDLKLKSGAIELMNWVENHFKNTSTNYAFLTAIPRGNDMPWAINDKVLWAQKYFPEVPVFFGPYSQDKHKHATPGDILIDDRLSNINNWEEVGGIGHLYTTWENCKDWLEVTLKITY